MSELMKQCADLQDKAPLLESYIEKLRGYSYVSGGVTYLVRCHECGNENYAMNVSTGICYLCGHDANPKTQP